jgi:hypothetical protein
MQGDSFSVPETIPWDGMTTTEAILIVTSATDVFP